MEVHKKQMIDVCPLSGCPLEIIVLLVFFRRVIVLGVVFPLVMARGDCPGGGGGSPEKVVRFCSIASSHRS